MKIFTRLSFFIVLILLCCSLISFAQEYKVTLFQVEQGLPTNLTKSIVKDDKGFVWIGTDAGLLRFDGKNFTQYKKEVLSPYFKSFFKTPDKLYAVCDQSITTIDNQIDTVYFSHIIRTAGEFSDTTVSYPKNLYPSSQKDKFWLSEPTSVSLWDKNKGVKRYVFTDKYRTSSFLRSFTFATTGQGTLFLASQQGHLFYFDESADKFIEIDLQAYKIGVINSLVSYEDNKIWIGGQNGLYELDFNANTKAIKVQLIAPITGISIIQKDILGNYFVGTWATGMYRVQVKDGKIAHQHLDNLKLKVINDIYITPDGGEVWVSTDEGIALLRISLFCNTTFPYDRSYIQDIVKGNGNTMYVSDGAKVYTIDVGTEKFIASNASHQAVATLFQDDILCLSFFKDTLHYASAKGYLYRYPKAKAVDTLSSSPSKTSIFHLTHDKEGNMWAAKDEFLLKISPSRQLTPYQKDKGVTSKILVTHVTNEGEIFAGGLQSDAYLFRYNPETDKFINISLLIDFKGEAEMVINDIGKDKEGNIWLASNYGLLKQTKNKIEKIDLGKVYDVKSLLVAEDKIWLGTDVGIVAYQNGIVTLFNEFSGLPSKTMSFRGLATDNQNRLWAATAQGLGFIQPIMVDAPKTPKPVLLGFQIDDLAQYATKTTTFMVQHGQKVEIRYATLVYPAENIFYQYRILGVTDKWSAPTKESDLIIPQTSFGEYILEVKAMQQGAAESEVLAIPFTVTKPYFLQWWAIALYVLVFVGFIWLCIKLYTAKLLQDKEKLETLVEERTLEVKKQNRELGEKNQELKETHEELKQQSEELRATLELVQYQSKELEKKNHDMTASINYALRIQRAILPLLSSFEETFGKDNYFILYKPKDIVSGDFYWLEKIDNRTILAVADCTGHGVPGAFMTMIGSELLFEVTHSKNITEPSLILTELNHEIGRVLKKGETEVQDGMDISLLMIDHDTKTVVGAGAKNNIYFIKPDDTAIETVLVDRFSIGGKQRTEEVVFTQQVLPSSATIYLCTDGFQDQFGGAENKKFLSKNLKKLLYDIHKQPFSTQKQHLDDTIENWRGAIKKAQMDDILIVGVKL
jgi:ligand-binding sensor domain-containing protein/serine phosphatase RsbU (regulator of sigma subunit)